MGGLGVKLVEVNPLRWVAWQMTSKATIRSNRLRMVSKQVSYHEEIVRHLTRAVPLMETGKRRVQLKGGWLLRY